MAQARFSIGIDLGTTSSALAFVPLDGEARSEALAIPQWDTLSSLAEAETLPSFLYRPDDATAAQLAAESGAWIAGRLARTRAGETPGRVVQSAKSWLRHHAADCTQPFLPWGSDELSHDDKISPIRASAVILNALRGAWNARFGGAGADFAFDAQNITVTVPASFDAAAQRLTLMATAEAGFPDTVRLIEEPQAAFYRWLEWHDSADDLWKKLEGGDADTHHVLVIDIGGGTSDFSLFELRRVAASPLPAIRRVAVSDHILLGGDNIDLALAHLAESRLAEEDTKLSGTQWDHLVARCRDLKEKALSDAGNADDVFPVSVPGRGFSLIGSALTAQLSRRDIDGILFDGFFPACDSDAKPAQARGALTEWGLPYAADSAVTRHLAAFLAERPRVDAVLFNGGSLTPEPLRQRILGEVGKWQEGPPPLELDNPEPVLAVARGAARFGKVLHRKAERIEAGAARAVFIEAHRKSEGRSLVCILPRNSSPEETYEIADLGLQLRINSPVRFQTYSSTRHAKSRAGDILRLNDDDFHPLPSLETVAKVEDSATDGRTVPVTLSARLNELGLLQVSCVSADPAVAQAWPLEFNLRPHEGGAGPMQGQALEAEPNVMADALDAAKDRIEALFSQPLAKRDKLSATRLLKSLEEILGLGKGEWNWVVIRALWPTLEECMAWRQTSIEHEETWLILAGFLLRPGFGAPMDDARMDGLWQLRQRGLCFPGKRIKLQEYILWRRVSGGLDRDRQERILKPELDKLRQAKNVPTELVLLAGSLERIGHELKTELVGRFIETALDLARENKHFKPYISALGLMLNRTPLYAGPEAVASPDLVEQAYEAFSGLDWKGPDSAELQTLFLRAARVVDNRSLDVPKSLRNKIANKLAKADVAPLKVARLKKFVPVERSERVGLYGEALPPGLILGDT